MTRARVLIPLLILLILLAAGLAAEPLDREAVLRLARERAVGVHVAAARQDLAAGELRAARVWRHNPELEFEAGPRNGPDGESWDRSIGLSQRLDLAGRGARIDAAGAAYDAARDRGQATTIVVLGQAARLHLQALHANEQRRLAAEAVALHARLLEIAERRFEAGETGRLDVYYATVGAERARMRLATTVAAEQDVLAALAGLLALEPGHMLTVTGDLAWPLPDAVALVQDAARRHPDLLALQARSRAAEARVRLAGAARWPEIGLGASVGREEEADIVHFGLSLGLPLFSRGQGQREAATAAGRIAAIELEAAGRLRADHTLRAWQRHSDLQAALAHAAKTTTTALGESGRLAEQSYRLGEIPLDRVLLVERENLDARNELNDLRLTAALAALDVAEIAALPPLAASLEETP